MLMRFAAFAVFGFIVTIPAIGRCSGFGVFTQSATALGQANAVTAHHNQPSAVFFNPALLANLPGTQVEIGTTAIFPDKEFTSAASGDTVEEDNDPRFPSTLYVSHQVNDRWSLGVGAYFPFGLGSKWPENWEGRYLITEQDLFTLNVRPVVSWQAHPRLALSAGIDYVHGNATLKNKVNLTALTGDAFGPLPDAEQEFDGDSDGWGFNLALAAKLTDNLRFGAAYRSEVDLDFDGDVTFEIPPLSPGADNLIRPALTERDGSAELTLPQQLTFGLAYMFADLTLEAGARWEDWAAYDALILTLEDGTTTRFERDWDDTWAFNIGGRYRYSPTLSLLFGYMLQEGAAPGNTLEPAVPDSDDTHLWTLGSEVSYSRFLFSLAYAYQQSEKTEKDNRVGADPGGTANGDYESDAHMVAFSISSRF